MIHTCLDLSTGHLTRRTMGLLDSFLPENHVSKLEEWGWPAMTIATYDHGCFVTVPEHDHTSIDQREALPRDLRDVLVYAQLLGIPLLRFDSDGDVIDGLPTYEW